MIRLSILTPVLNGAAFVRECLENVLAQACHHCEHILVDGGSADGTVGILREYSARYPQVRFISEPGLGQAAAMNRALELSSGEIVGFLNVDDFYEPRVLTRVLAHFANAPIPSVLVGNCNVWTHERIEYVNRPSDLRLQRLLLGFEFCSFPFNPSAYFYHRSLHDLIGPFDEADEFAMDVDFLLRAARRANMRYIDETWGNFRLHARSKTVVDKAGGRQLARQEALFERHRTQLPWSQRTLLRFKLAWKRRPPPLDRITLPVRFRERVAARRVTQRAR